MTVAPQTTEQLYRELHHGLRSFVARRVSSEADAEDIVQDVFTRIHVHGAGLENVESVTGWIYRVTRNAITDHYRANASAARAVERLSEEVDVVAPQPEPDAAEELARCVKPFVAQLQEDYRSALSLTELGGLTQKEAAHEAGISVSGMKSRVQRGRAKLGELFRTCCAIELDVRKGITGFEPRADDDPCCK